MNNVYSNVFPNQYAAAPSSKGAFIVPIGWLVTGATRRFATAYPWCTISKHYPLCDERRTVPKLFVIKENLKVVKMSNHQLNYKKKPVGFVDASAGRLVRTVRQEERRRINRAENYARHRDVPEAPEIEESTSTSADREIRFQRWKAERDIRKRIESQKQKPAFKVGVVHHKFYSPIGEKKNVKPVPCHGRGVRKEKHHPTPPKRITRATQKRLEAKLAGTAVTPGMASTSGLQSSRTKSIKNPKFRTTSNKTVDSFAPEHYPFKAPAGLSEVPLFGKFAIPKTTETDKSCSESKIDISFEDEKEEPWPHANHPSVDIMASQKIQSSLVRQNALRFSTDTLDQQNYTNSSIEAVNLRLSSEDESPDETDESEKAESINIAAQLNFSAIAEKIDYEETGKKDAPDSDENVEQIDKPETAELPEMAEVIAIENSTPPRSGSPAPASFSPYIVSSRGKGSARKEQQIKMGIRRSLSGSKIPMKDTVMQNLNISIEEEEQTAQYFKFILDSTIERFTEMCNKWEEIKQEPDLSEDAQYQINQAIGQTNLLMKKKFERFRQLILDCETGKGEMLVTCKDLQGFWDMMYIDVENCNSRFSKLDFLRSKNWIEEQITVTNKRVMKKNTAAPKPKASAKSSARSWIMAARKKMTQSERPSDINIVSTDDTDCKKPASRTPLKDENSRRSLRESPAFGIQDKNSRRSLRESPAFGIQDKNSRRSLRESPASEIQDRRRSTSKATPKKTPTSLLKVVQLSQASKTIRSPLTIIKISKMCKTPEVTLDNTISYVNSDQTPAKGILKKAESSSGSESSAPKSTRKVDFNDDVFLDEVPVENEISEELQNSLDLGRALSRIDTYDEEDDDCNDVATHFMKNVTIRKVEKRLDFEDESFIETENTDTGEAIVAAIPETPAVYDTAIPEPPTIPEVMVVPPTPIQSALKTGRKTTKSSRRSSQILETSIEEGATEEETSFVISPKVLRNRTVPGTTPNKSNRRSIKSPVVDKHLLDSSIKENCEPLGKKNEGSNSDIRDIVTEKEASKEHSKRRRSTRKSIKLNPDGCNTCTPKSNANKSVSAQIMEDLITFDSPINRPIRNRRSSFK